MLRKKALISAFGFTNAKSRFSHNAAQGSIETFINKKQHNGTPALERSVISYWELKTILWLPAPLPYR